MYLKKKLMVLPLAAALVLSLSSCFLLPKEAEIPEIPLVTPYDGSDFTTAYVIRGDLELSKTISCTYQATQEVRYSFSDTGSYFGDIYVGIGDYVTAGTLLAEMDVSSVTAQIVSCEYSIQTLEVRLTEAREALNLALKTETLLNSGSTASSDARAASVAYIEASLEVQRLKLSELRSEKKALQLFADIDGMVTYVKTIADGAKTIKGEKIVTVTDDSTSVFVANTDSYESFPPGLHVDIESGGVTYRSVVTSAEELGIVLTGREAEGEFQKVYFVLLDAETPTDSNAKGEINLLNDLRKDILMVRSSAVFTLGDESMVYVQQDDGTKTAQVVETGLATTKFTQIVSGLSEGDCVIVS